MPRGEVPGEHTRAALSKVRVSGGVLCSYRASLVHDGLLEAVRTIFAARSGLPADWLDEVTPFDWVELEHFRTLLVSFADTTGLEQLRAITRRRMADSEHSNFYAPVLRSWMRSFGDSVEHTLRCVVPLWRAAFRHAVAPDLDLVAPGEIHLVMTGPMARALHSSDAMAAGFEGILLGILDLPRPRPLVDVEFKYARDEMLTVCKF
jgi:hypothetical protein